MRGEEEREQGWGERRKLDNMDGEEALCFVLLSILIFIRSVRTVR